MGLLGKPLGIFSLDESDRYIGSFISITDVAAIRSKDTKPVMIVREGLWSRGFRYRLNSTKLLGHSDLVLRKCRTCIFVSDIWMNDHQIIAEPYPQFEEEEDLLKAAEEEI